MNFDGHMHFVNAKYVIDEVTEMDFYRVLGLNPGKEINFDDLKVPKSMKLLLKNIFFKRIKDLSKSPSELYSDYQNIVSQIMDGEVGLIPLMMDIFFILSKKADTQQDLNSYHEQQTTIMEDDNYILPFIEGNTFQQTYGRAWSTMRNNYLNKPIHLKMIDSAVLIHNKAHIINTYNYKQELYKDTFITKGFDYEISTLGELKRNHPSKVYPFYAFDPRRKGSLELAKKLMAFPEEQRFAGIKLYPSMGYNPELCHDVLDYCNRESLPITIHAGNSGLGNNNQDDFGDPIHWKEILRAYQPLNFRINFAHFGNDQEGLIYRNEESCKYHRTIIDLMEEFPNNVYSDISCYLESEDLQVIRNIYENKPSFRERILFGTDFPAFMLYEELDVNWQMSEPLNNYYNRVKNIFGHDFMDICNKNVRKFLGID